MKVPTYHIPKLVQISAIHGDCGQVTPEVSEMANKLLQVGIFAVPLQVRSNGRDADGMPQYRLVPGFEKQLAVAREAEKINPYHELVNSWVDVEF